jgi:hypothetical protein
MVFYGIIKFFSHGQFQAPGLAQLLQPLGELRPMSLLWNFMGYSRAYTMLTGIVEVSGGILLFAPRLAMLGAIISFAAMSNVFLLNMCYGVHLRLYSFHLLFMAVFLLAPELRWLGEAIVLRKPVQPRASSPLFRSKRLTSAMTALQVTLGACVFTFLWISEWRSNRDWDLPRNPLHGIWAVEQFAVGPSASGASPWMRVVFDDPKYAMRMDFAIQAVDGTSRFFLLHFDEDRRTLGLSKLATLLKCYYDTEGDHWDNFRQRELRCPVDAQFTFEHPESNVLIIDGLLDGEQIHASLRRTDREFPLQRPFHWLGGVE